MTGRAAEWLVAHRGWPARHPENSLEGIRAALAAGARFVEFDVQISADGCPVVIHDNDLRRLTGRGRRLTGLRQDEVAVLRLRGGARVPTLEQALAAVESYPGATAFVELKRHSIKRFGHSRAVDAVCDRLRKASCSCVFLSFDRRAARRARYRGIDRIGWVFRRWGLINRLRARTLRPDYLFVRADRVPAARRPFWPGPWQWAVYDVDTLEQARNWRARGADLVEVDDLPGMLDVERDGT